MPRCSAIVADYPAPPRRLPLARKTASRGLSSWSRHRVGRAAPQPTGTPWKTRPRYDGARRGAVLPQNGNGPVGGEIIVTALRHYATNPFYSGSSAWWMRFDAIPGASDRLETLLAGIGAGLVPGNRTTVPARDLGLPGGKNTFYQRYDIPGFLHDVPGVLDGARIAHVPGSPDFYFAPFHGRATDDVPGGYILITPGLGR